MERARSEGISLPSMGAREWELAAAWLYVVRMLGLGGGSALDRCQGLNRLVGTARRAGGLCEQHREPSFVRIPFQTAAAL